MAEVIDSLTDLASIYKSLAKKIESSDVSDEIFQALVNTDRMVEKAISFIVENSVLPRIESINRVVN